MTSFSKSVLAWFHKHGRTTLPWQQAVTPYRVWVSEIMLQQTQVNTVIPYFERFMARFPTVTALATASLDEVLHLWTGLGYYARGRHLHRAAQIIVGMHAGELPADLPLLEQLPGIGRSTAGAILALGHGQRGVILDGNVKRVLARYHALNAWPGEKDAHQQLWHWAEQYTPKQCADAYGQAMMDLGALVCRKSAPLCGICPVHKHCAAYASGDPAHYPLRKPRAVLPKKAWYVLILHNKAGEVLLTQRPMQGIWGGLWSLPECVTPKKLADWCQQTFGCRIQAIEALSPIQHTFTHFQLTLKPIAARLISPLNVKNPTLTWYHPKKSQKLGFAAPIRRLLESWYVAHDLVS
jgi:A/G-specific adenine glycosylase